MKTKNFFLIILTSIILFFYNTAFCFDREAFIQNYLWDKVSNLSVSQRPKIILVLGGGGARGFAHIGVLKALREANVHIDMVVGTSIGALVGALYCAGVPIEKIEDVGGKTKWEDITNIGYISMFKMIVSDKLLSTEKLEKYVRNNIGDLQFFQLDIPFACVATDISTGEKIIFKEGNVAVAARASATVPGICAPVEYAQRYLVDGGLVENIPVSVAKLFNPDIIITVAVSADITKNSFNNVFSTLFQAIYIQGQKTDEMNLSMSDIVIKPKVNDVSAIDLNKSSKCIEAGFLAGKESISKIKEIIIKKTYEKNLQ